MKTTISNWIGLVVILLFAWPNAAGSAQIGPGFYQISSGWGIEVYQKDYRGGEPDFVTVVNLHQATAISVVGHFTDAPNASIEKHPFSDFRDFVESSNTDTQRAAVMINGTFFDYTYPWQPRTTLSLGLKAANTILSYGTVPNQYGDRVRTLAWGSGQASIQPYSRATFEDWRWPDVVGAFATSQRFDDDNKYSPRNLMGIRDSDGDGTRETMLVFSSHYTKKQDAINILKSFGVDEAEIVVTDGGASNGLVVDGNYKMPAPNPLIRTIAHVMVFLRNISYRA